MTSTVKLVLARDQTRLPCEFGANPFSGSRDISYANETTQTDGAKNNLLQFAACGNNLRVPIVIIWPGVSCV